MQLYINDPVASVSRPLKELKGFQRVALGPGQTKRVEFVITSKELEFWTKDGWTAEEGRFRVWIGPDSTRGPDATFELLGSSQRGRGAAVLGRPYKGR